MNQISAEQYPPLAMRTERIPTTPTILDAKLANTLAHTIQAAINLAQQVDVLKRHIFYGKAVDLAEVESRLPDASYECRVPVALTPVEYRLLHSAMGILTEAGEYAETIADHVIKGMKLDEVNLRAELGDLDWYQAIPANVFRWTWAQWMTQNIEKLRVRYPDKFTEEHALNRDLDAERQAVAATPSP